MELKITNCPISDLQFDPNNVRKHGFKNLEAVKSSLRKFGQVKPIVIHNNIVVAGNGTLLAAKEMGWKKIDVVELPKDWDSAKIKAYAIADNRTAELADWDMQLLNLQLEELKESGYELHDVGFENLELQNLIRIDESKNSGATDPYGEWAGMPDYKQDNKLSAFRVTIHFATESDADDFFASIDRTKKSSMWWPKDDGLIGSNVNEQYIAKQD